MFARVKSNFVIFDNLPYVVVNVRFFIKSSFIIQICPFYYTHTQKNKKNKNKQTNKTKKKFIVPEPEPICAYFFFFEKHM